MHPVISKSSQDQKKYIEKIVKFVDDGFDIINGGDLDDFGRLLHESWLLKKLSSNITNKKINNLYNYAIENGALGGKLLGAGGGGFLLMYMKKKYRKNFLTTTKTL